jgi:hypothetical protein
MADRSPCSDWPDLIFAGHPGTQLPCIESTPYLCKTSNNLVHFRALRWVFFDHVGDEWFNEFEPVVFLTLTSQDAFL